MTCWAGSIALVLALGALEQRADAQPAAGTSPRTHVEAVGKMRLGELRVLSICGVDLAAAAKQESPLAARNWVCRTGNAACNFVSDTRVPDENDYQLSRGPEIERKGAEAMFYPDESALFGYARVQCARDEKSRHAVVESDLRGIPMSTVYPALTGTESRFVVLRAVGAYARHQRPASVRATVELTRNKWWAVANPDKDLELAIQVFTDGRWDDVATKQFTTTWRRDKNWNEPPKSVETYSLEAGVPENHDVRLEVRMKVRVLKERELVADGYDIRSASIFVEQCYPDPSRPGRCLE